MGKTPGPPVATGGHRWDTGGTPNPPDCIRTICKFRTTGGHRGYSTGVDLTMYGFTLHVGEITGRYFRRDNPCSKVWRLS